MKEVLIILSNYVFECIRIKVKPTASTNAPISYFNFDCTKEEALLPII